MNSDLLDHPSFATDYVSYFDIFYVTVDPVPQKTPAPSNASGTSGRKKTGRYQTLTKTRKFIVDGKEVVKTTTRYFNFDMFTTFLLDKR